MKRPLPILMSIIGMMIFPFLGEKTLHAQCPDAPAILEAPNQTKYCSGERLGTFEYQPNNNGDGTIIQLDFNGHVQTIGTPATIPTSPFVFREECGPDAGYYTVSILCAADKTVLSSATLTYEVYDIPDEGIDFQTPDTDTCNPAIQQLCNETEVVYGLRADGPFFDFVPDVDPGETVAIYYQIKATNGPDNCFTTGTYTMNCPDNCVKNAIAYNDSPICNGEGVNLSVTPVEGATYVWSGPADFSATGNDLYIVNVAAGIYRVTVSVPGCEDITAATIIEVYDALTPSITKGESEVCNPAYGIVYSTEGVYDNYYWTVTNGTITSGQYTSIITVDWEDTGNGNVQVEVSNDDACGAYLSESFYVAITSSPQEPEISAASILYVCEGETATIIPTGAIEWEVYEYFLSDGITPATEDPNVSISEDGVLTVSNVQDALIFYIKIVDMDYVNCETDLVPVFISLKSTQACTDPCENTIPPTLTTIESNDYCGSSLGVTYSINRNDYTTYLWEVVGGVITGGQNTHSIRVDWLNPGTGTVNVMVTDANGCTSTLNEALNVTVYPQPDAPTIDDTRSILMVCEGNTATLTLNELTNNQNYQFFLADQQTPAINDPNIEQLGSNGLLINNVTSNSTLYAQTNSTDPITCSSNLIPIQIGLLAPEDCVECPTESLIASNEGPVCEGRRTQLNASLIPGASYTWTGPSNFSSNEQNPVINNPQAGTYQVTATIPNCETLTATTQLIVNPLPQPQLVQYIEQVCVPATNVVYSISTGFATYDWTVAGGMITSGQGTNSITVDWSFTGQGSVNVLVTNGSNCADALSVPLNVQLETCTSCPTGPISVNNDGPACEGENVQLSVETIQGATYTWTGPNNFTSTQQNPLLNNTTLLQSGTYTVTVEVPNCAALTGSTTIEINTPPDQANAGEPETTCTTTCFLAANAPLHGTGYWTLVSAQPGTNPIIEEPTEHITNALQLTQPGEYIFRWIVTNGAGNACPDSYDDMLVIVAAPLATTPATFECSADGTTYTVQTILSGGAGNYSVEPANAGFFTGNTFQSYPITTGQTFEFHFADDSYCEGASINGSYDNCTQIIAIDDVETTPINTPVTIEVLNNDFNNGNFSILNYSDPENGTLVFDPATQTFTFIPDNGFTGVVTYTYTIINEAGDIDTATVTITIEGSSCPTISIETNRICENGQVGTYSLVFNVTGGAAPYAISGSYTGVAQEGEVLTITLADGRGYQLQVIDANGCESSIEELDFVPCTKLSVELIDFAATAETTGNNIYWVIAVQQNNDYFLLEHSTNGIDFEVIYTEKGDIDNFMTMTYGFLHKAVPGIHYYRLQQVDIGGEKTNLGTISIQRGEHTLSITQLYPIPAVDELFLDFVIPQQGVATITIYDLLGARIAEQQDWFEAGQYLTSFQVTDFPEGVYFIVLESKSKRVTSRFVKE